MQTAAAAAIGIGMLLLIHRYPGVNHDGSIYFGLTLFRLRPDIFGQDLFFAFGSQGSYTLLPWLLAQLTPHAGLPALFMLGALLGLLAFAAAAWLFLRRLLPFPQRAWAWLAVITLHGMYGVIVVFTYGEPFLTGRPLAEALSLLALALLVDRRWGWAGLALGLAGALHPLQALGAGLIAWSWLVLQDRRWLHLAWLGLPVLLLGFTPIKPFADLYRVLDPGWYRDLADFTRQLFITHWYPTDWATLAFDVLLLGYAAWQCRDAFGRWCLAALIGLLLGCAASLVLADLLHLALPTALQFWRVQWLAHLLANAAVGVLLYRDLTQRAGSRASVLALAVLMANSGFLWTWIPILAMHAAWPSLAPRMTPGFRRMLVALAWLTMLGLLTYYVAEEWLPFRLAHYRFDLYAIDRRILAFPLVGMGLGLSGLWLWQHARRRWQQIGMLLLAVTALLVAALRWDARSPVARALEAQSFNPALFGTPLPERAQVFWDLPMYPAVWVVLQRADYFSPWQLAGSVFNRGTPEEGRRRLERMRPVIEEDMYCQDRSVPARERAHCRISNATLYQACRPGSTPPPDYLVLPYRQDPPALGQWRIPDPVSGGTAVTFWLYACPTILQSLSHATSTSKEPEPPR
ncbi:MAG: hypothetical protein ACOY4A_11545 [Pseudomonadota bacterium]